MDAVLGQETPEVVDDFLDDDLFNDLCSFLVKGNWSYGWRSSRGHTYGLWHWHFAGGDKDSREPCDSDLSKNTQAALVNQVWMRLKETHLQGFSLLRAYANGQTYGLDGGIHVDNLKREECHTAIVYAHNAWAVGWGGETVFYTEDGEVMTSILPVPGRLVLFDAGIAHAAKAPSRECPALRVALVFKAIKA
jgi:SM-20-related protein